jgi:hypothetical protein
MGQSDAAQRAAVRELRGRKGLREELERALADKDKYLALEVISALGMKEAVPALLPLTDCDENGAIHLTLAALVDPQNVRAIEDAFRKRLEGVTATPTSEVVQVILLDTLGRMGTRLDDRLLRSLYRSPNAHVREAVLYHLDLQGDAVRRSKIEAGE